MSKHQLITHSIIKEISNGIERAREIYILSSFIMESGVSILIPFLKGAIERGASIKCLTGDYLYITQPTGIAKLLELGKGIEIRLWKSEGVSFHPKSYMFQFNDDEGLLIVGSSNLSRSALQHGVEWNLSLEVDNQQEILIEAIDQFNKLFCHEKTIPINSESLAIYKQDYENFHKKIPNLSAHWTEQESLDVMFPLERQELSDAEGGSNLQDNSEEIAPRQAQLEALRELQILVEEEYNKAMVVMATGLGKTYLAAFFAQNYNKVLFIAHREEILNQSVISFSKINPNKTYGIFNGKQKDTNVDYLFASITTLANPIHLKKFATQNFDLIVVDEFHHAAASTYQRVLEYFQPQFLLGITATPDRMDNKDVYAICDGNIAYQIHFLEAVQKGWLSPFHYFGVFDEIDYSQIKWLGTRYDEQQLLQAQIQDGVAEKIYASWMKHKQTRTIGFCSSVSQASYLAQYFQSQGTLATFLYAGSSARDRRDAIYNLNSGDIEVIFTVDLFNEGVDIPAVDTLLFTRPTNSLTVFIQQVGRGLRISKDKSYCTIIDLIGNYRNADIKLRVFDTSENMQIASEKRNGIIPVVPENCSIEFDIRVIDLFKELAKKKQPKKEKLRDAYNELKLELGRRPVYLELHLQGTELSKSYFQEFRSYAGFLYWADELTEKEKLVYKKYKNLIEEVERTNMTKSYKMVLLLYMLTRGEKEWTKPVNPKEVAPFFHKYLTEKEYRMRRDFSDSKTTKFQIYNESKISNLIATMPMTKWSGSSNGLLSFENNIFRINVDIVDDDISTLYEWIKQICHYRLHTYFERSRKNK